MQKIVIGNAKDVNTENMSWNDEKSFIKEMLLENMSMENNLKILLHNHIKYGEYFTDISSGPADYKKTLSCCWCHNTFRGFSDELYCNNECEKLADKENGIENE